MNEPGPADHGGRRVGVALGCAALLALAVVLATTGGGAGRPQSASSGPGSGGARHRGAHTATVALSNAAGAGTLPGPAWDRVLRHTSYLALGGRRRREVALTFDDGPSPFTPKILAVLRRMHAPATFFVMGRWARAYPKLVAAEVSGGAEVGDHTQTHPFLASLSSAAQSAEIDQAASSIAQAGAPVPQLFRPPYGSFDQATLSILRARRMLMVLWSADTKDYSRPGVSQIAYTAISGAQPGAVILMHDGGGDRSQTVAALPRIIRRLRERGFALVTVSQLVADDPPPAGQSAPHSLAGRG